MAIQTYLEENNEKKVKASCVSKCPAACWENPDCMWLVDGKLPRMQLMEYIMISTSEIEEDNMVCSLFGNTNTEIGKFSEISLFYRQKAKRGINFFPST
jgi:hypothetical protein